MRLIDADKLIELTQKDMKYAFDNGFLDMAFEREHLIKVIRNQPTAFDMEKVVEQLEGLSNAEADYYYSRSNDVIDREDAIDFVKKGGVE